MRVVFNYDNHSIVYERGMGVKLSIDGVLKDKVDGILKTSFSKISLNGVVVNQDGAHHKVCLKIEPTLLHDNVVLIYDGKDVDSKSVSNFL